MNNAPDVTDFVNSTKLAFERKANHNKNESLICFIIILISSLTAPLFITLGKSELLSKIVPSVLSVVAAGLTSWLQLRKPQRLWGIYRSAQRRIETEITRHQFAIEDYRENTKADSLLVERVCDISALTHSEWTEIVPSPEGITLHN